MRDQIICPVCYGEAQEMFCRRCHGTSELSGDLMQLHSANEWTKKHDPEWTGCSKDRPGITLFAQAEWYRNRGSLKHLFLSEVRVEGFTSEETVGREPVVRISLFSAYGRPLAHPPFDHLSLYGFSWGYSGEGPNGLANVLVDIGFFSDHEEAMRYISNLKIDQKWSREKVVNEKEMWI